MRKTLDHVNQSDKPAGADDLLDALHALMHLLRARQHQALRDGEQDLTPLEARVLGFFARRPGATQSELAEHSGRDKGQLARIVNALRERGWLEAHADENDRRVTRLHLSERARAQHQAVQRERRRLAEASLAGLAAAERAQLRSLLERMRANLEAGG